MGFYQLKPYNAPRTPEEKKIPNLDGYNDFVVALSEAR